MPKFDPRAAVLGATLAVAAVAALPATAPAAEMEAWKSVAQRGSSAKGGTMAIGYLNSRCRDGVRRVICYNSGSGPQYAETMVAFGRWGTVTAPERAKRAGAPCHPSAQCARPSC